MTDGFVPYNPSFCLITAMAYTVINSEDRLVQVTFAAHLENQLGWDSLYEWNQEGFGPTGTCQLMVL